MSDRYLTAEELLGMMIYGSVDDRAKVAEMPGFDAAMEQVKRSRETNGVLWQQAVDEMMVKRTAEKAQQN